MQDSLRDDRALVGAALADRNAYAELVKRYEGRLTGYVRRLLGGQSQATEDVVQEAFIKAYVNLNDFDRRRPFSPWLYRIARNEAISYLRRQRGERLLISGEDARLILERVGDDSDLEGAIGTIEAGHHLRAAIAALDAKYRDVLVLRYLEDKSYDEISEIMRLPPGTVATYIRRGLARLRAKLTGAGIGAVQTS